MDNNVLVLEKRLPRVFWILSGRRCRRPQAADLKGSWAVIGEWFRTACWDLLGFAARSAHSGSRDLWSVA